MYSNPTFDPNPLVIHDTKTAQTHVRRSCSTRPTTRCSPARGASSIRRARRSRPSPRRSRSQDNVDVDKQFPFARPSIPLPLTNDDARRTSAASGAAARSRRASSCRATRRSAQVGLDLGDTLATGIQRFGVNTDAAARPTSIPPIVRQHRAASRARSRPTSRCSRRPRSARARSRSRRSRWRSSPKSVATGGVILEPHVVDRDRATPTARSCARFGPKEWQARDGPRDRGDADAVHDRGRRNRGTGTAAQIPGIRSRARPAPRRPRRTSNPHAWFIAFAPADAPAVRDRGARRARRHRRPTPRRPAAGSPRRSPRKCSARCSGRNRNATARESERTAASQSDESDR